MRRMIDCYNGEVTRFQAAHGQSSKKEKEALVDEFVLSEATQISWSGDLKVELMKGRQGEFRPTALVSSIYRPYQRQWLYFDRQFNNSVYQLPRLFPAGQSNLTIMVKQRPPVGSQLALMVNSISELQSDGGTQCFPLHYYDVADEADDDAPQGELLARQPAGQLTRRDAITDAGLAHFTDAYANEAITKDDVFYYVYGLLHSEEYRERYADNLTKQLPRIPLMKRVEDFRAFVAAGRRLGDLHVNFESVEPFPVTIREGDLRLANIPDPVAYYRVEKMKFGGKRPNLDKTTVVYNPKITITGIPLEAYDYVVNGKPALEWVMERQCVKTDPASGIVNDANRYAIETVGDPAYPFKLFCRIITVSLETMRIVRGLPGLDIREGSGAASAGATLHEQEP